jgi:hypothetical protein
LCNCAYPKFYLSFPVQWQPTCEVWSSFKRTRELSVENFIYLCQDFGL